MRISASDQVQLWLCGLAPRTKRRVRAALKALGVGDPNLDLKALRGELEGFYRLRVGDYRVRFRVKGDILTVDKIGHRKDIYED